MSSYPHLYDGSDSRQSVYSTGTTKHHPIGTRGILDDGRVFHYASLVDTTGITPGQLVQMAAPVGNHITQSAIPTGTTAVNTSDALKTISVTLGATLSHTNQYENGLLKIEAATTGAGQTFRIPSHPSVLSAGAFSFQTNDPVLVAVTDPGAIWSLVSNPWGNVVVQPAAVTAPAAGVSLATWAAASTVEAPVFGWVQTWGLCAVLSDNSAFVAGHGLIHENFNVVGSCSVAVETDIVQRIGVAMEAITTTGYASVFLQIAG